MNLARQVVFRRDVLCDTCHCRDSRLGNFTSKQCVTRVMFGMLLIHNIRTLFNCITEESVMQRVCHLRRTPKCNHVLRYRYYSRSHCPFEMKSLNFASDTRVSPQLLDYRYCLYSGRSWCPSKQKKKNAYIHVYMFPFPNDFRDRTSNCC
jgi:hypothetical protein